MTKPTESNKNTQMNFYPPPSCCFSGLGNSLQAGECRDAGTGVGQVLQHTDDPYTVFSQSGHTSGLSTMSQGILGFQ